MFINYRENDATGAQLRDRFQSEALAIAFDRLLPVIWR
jgi:hypothetical protein